jgi:hypothetical protein
MRMSDGLSMKSILAYGTYLEYTSQHWSLLNLNYNNPDSKPMLEYRQTCPKAPSGVSSSLCSSDM